jgi:WD40 repeat protein
MTARTRHRRAPIAALIALAIGLAPAATRAGDPELVFQTIHTEHFNIHFHQGLERTARLTATIAEEVHDRLTILFGWEVDGPTELVISDPTDSANGMAMASPRPQIRLYATGPTMDSALANHDHWLRTLIVHEYVHVVHLQMHGGLARVINAIFGDVYLPNQMQPRWFIEGLAVVSETYETTAGRIRSSFFNMVIRTAALEGKLLELDELSNVMRQWPRGHDHYIYGAMFLDYVRTRFGEDKITEICQMHGSEPIPYGLNRVFKRVLGVELTTLYEDWATHVKQSAAELKDEVEAAGHTQSTAVTTDGETKGRPIFSVDGDRLLLAAYDGNERSGIFEVSLDGKERRRLVLSSGGSPISADRAGQLYYTRSAPYKQFYYFNDVFVLVPGAREPTRLTHGLRAREVAASPRGDRLALTVNDDGTTRLVLADDQGRPLKVLVSPEPDDQVFDPAWSPDGRQVAFVRRIGAQVDLFLVDVETGEQRRLTDDRALEQGPVFDPSGRYLLFSSDRTGIENIYAFDLEQGRALMLTNVITGATGPAVSPDGERLAFLRYSAYGWDLHLMPFDPGSARPAPGMARVPEDPPPAPLPDDEAEVGPYNPLPSLLPRYWMIGMTAAENDTLVQAVTGMRDAVGRHGIAAELNYGINEQAISSRVAYSYSGLVPSLHLGFSRSMSVRDSGYVVGGEDRRWVQEVLSGSLSLSAPVLGVDRNHSLSAGYSVTYAQPRDEPEVEYDPQGDYPRFPRQFFRAGFDFSWSFSDVVSSVFGITPEDGRSLSASVGFYHPSLGGTQKLVVFRYGWTEYQETPWLDHHVVALRVNGGVYVSDPPEQASFAVGGYVEQNIVDAIWNNKPAGLPSLRGYPPGAFSGDQYHSLRLEYRFPLWWVESGYQSLPAFFRRLQAGVFSDNVLVTFDELDTDDWKSGIGAELVWAFLVGYFMPVTIRTGYAYGLMDGGAHEIIVVMGSSF